MNDQPDRTGGDGLPLRGIILKILTEEITQPRPEYLPAHFNNAVTRLLALVNERAVATRDAAEGAGPFNLADRLAEHPEDNAGGVGFLPDALERARARSAPPKPAPDAMRVRIDAYRQRGGMLFSGFTIADELDEYGMRARQAPHSSREK